MVGMVLVLVLGVLYCTTCHRRGGSWSVLRFESHFGDGGIGQILVLVGKMTI